MVTDPGPAPVPAPVPPPAPIAANPDDIFAETRMSFGDHIEELRKYLLRAIYGLLVIFFGGLLLDGIGEALEMENVGLGRPMLKVIVDPVETQVRDFYTARNKKSEKKLDKIGTTNVDKAELTRIRKKYDDSGGRLTALTSEERELLLGAPVEMPVVYKRKDFEKGLNLPHDPNAPEEFEAKQQVYPAYISYLANQGEGELGNKQYVTTLSVQEPMMVYFKVSLLCSAVLASPWILFQLWAFIAAGLYPQERAYVYKFLTPSLILFLTGVLMCQFVVLPGAVKALIAFNNWIELDPDLRLNEWLGFALLLPVVFGVSFQTPLVMFFLNRIGMFSWTDYWARWKHATLILAFFSAIITPTPDIVTMLYLFVPMFGLYLIGVAVCKFFPPEHEREDLAETKAEEQVAV